MVFNINREASSGVTTLSESLLSEVAHQNPERTLNIYSTAVKINRSLPAKNYAKHLLAYQEKRFERVMKPGESLVGFSELFHIKPDRLITCRGRNGVVVNYHGWINPTHHGTQIFESVQDKLDDSSHDTLRKCCRLAALASIGVSTAHIFTDGSGRTAIGIADILLRRWQSKKLNMKEVESDNLLLEDLWAKATCSILPYGMRLKSVMELAEQKPSKQVEVKVLPEDGPMKIAYYYQLEMLLAENLTQAIGDFDLNMSPVKLDETYEFSYYVRKLSNFFMKRLVATM